jgi:hypothetical protein
MPFCPQLWTRGKDDAALSLGCRARLAQGPQGSSGRSWPQSLSREVSVRSATLWFDLLLFCYNFRPIIMNCHFFQKSHPKEPPLPKASPPDIRPNRPPGSPIRQAPRGHARLCESMQERKTAIAYRLSSFASEPRHLSPPGFLDLHPFLDWGQAR